MKDELLLLFPLYMSCIKNWNKEHSSFFVIFLDGAIVKRQTVKVEVEVTTTTTVTVVVTDSYCSISVTTQTTVCVTVTVEKKKKKWYHQGLRMNYLVIHMNYQYKTHFYVNKYKQQIKRQKIKKICCLMFNIFVLLETSCPVRICVLLSAEATLIIFQPKRTDLLSSAVRGVPFTSQIRSLEHYNYISPSSSTQTGL